MSSASPTPSQYFVAGGTLSADAGSYVERAADHALLNSLAASKFCYVLNSRQMGKSSLCVRTMQALEATGTRTAFVDLTKIGGRNVTPEQWYAGIVVEIGRSLDLRAELLGYWKENAHVSPVQRLFGGLRDVALTRLDAPLVVFFDEIDATRSLSFSADEFFAAIRECYNRRVHDPVLTKLSFCLLGVAVPSDLINSPTSTPFNIGERIYLQDFTADEVMSLAPGLQSPQRSESSARALLQRIHYWANGQPYLTQSLCQAVAADRTVKTPEDVDALVKRDLFEPKARETNINLADVANRALHAGDLEADPEKFRADLLSMYAAAWKGKAVADDEANRVAALLKLSGIMRPEGNQLKVRNRIYQRVFDQTWIRENMPGQELLRRRRSYWTGVSRAALAGIVVLALVGSLAWTENVRRKEAVAAQRAALAAKEREEHELYIARMNSMELFAHDGDSFPMRQILEETKNSPYRGWEWLYWNRIVHDSPEEYAVKDWQGMLYGSFSGDGSQLLITENNGRGVLIDRRTKQVLWHGNQDAYNPIIWCGGHWAKVVQSTTKSTAVVTDLLTGTELYRADSGTAPNANGTSKSTSYAQIDPIMNTPFILVRRALQGDFYDLRIDIVDIRSRKILWNFQHKGENYFPQPGGCDTAISLAHYTSANNSPAIPYQLLNLRIGQFIDTTPRIMTPALASPNGASWAYGVEGAVVIRTLKPQKVERRISLPANGVITPVAYETNGKSLWVHSGSGRVFKINLDGGAVTQCYSNAVDAAFCPASEEIALAGSTVRIISTRSKPNSDGLSPDSAPAIRWLAMGSDYMSVSGNRVCTYSGLSRPIHWFSNPELVPQGTIRPPPGDRWLPLNAPRGLWFRVGEHEMLDISNGSGKPRIYPAGTFPFCADIGDRFFSSGKSTQISAWRLSTGERMWSANVSSQNSIIIAPTNGETVAALCESGATLFDASSGQKIGDLQGPDGTYMVDDPGTAGDDYWIGNLKALYRFRRRSLTPELTIPLDGHFYDSATVSPDGKRIALTDSAGNITLLERESLQRLLKIPVYPSPTNRPCFTSDGRKLLFAVPEKGVAVLSGSDEDPTVLIDSNGGGKKAE